MEERKVKMERAIREEQMKKEVIDVTLPSRENMVDIVVQIPSPWRKNEEFRWYGI